MNKAKVRWLIAVVFAFIPGIALAQDTASLTGTVRDQSGAVISGAGTVVKNNDNGLAPELKTNTSADYLAAALPPGPYDITVTAPGFRRYQAENVTLRVAQNARIDITLQVGSVASQITVQGEGL